MKFKNFFPWVCALALLLPSVCSIAATNNPGTFYLPGSVPYDHDATNFIGRAGISPLGAEAKAIGRLVADLKSANLWTNLDALYPFVGSTSNSCAQNLVSTNWPVTWHGGITFNARGAAGNGVDGWGDTGYLQSTRGALTNSFHLYTWASGATGSGALIANQNGSTSYGGLGSIPGQFQGYQISATSGASGLAEVSGNALSTRITTNWLIMSDRLVATNLGGTAATPTNSVHLLGGIIGTPVALDGFSSSAARAASFGSGLTAAQATNYFIIMNRFHNALNRTLGTITP